MQVLMMMLCSTVVPASAICQQVVQLNWLWPPLGGGLVLAQRQQQQQQRLQKYLLLLLLLLLMTRSVSCLRW
jgi:hypothetical protein